MEVEVLKTHTPGVVLGSGRKDRHGKLIYHRASCPWAEKLNTNALIEFASAFAAEFRGYDPCKVCKPNNPKKQQRRGKPD